MTTARDRALSIVGSLPLFRGRDRIGTWIARILNHGADPIALARLRCGTKVFVDLRSPDHWQVFTLHCYDQGLVEEIQRTLTEPGSVFVDIGASVGLISMGLAPHVKSLEGQIIAYEPHKNNRVLFTRSVDRNGLSGVIDVFPYALGCTEGTVSLVISESSAKTGNAVIIDDHQSGSVSECSGVSDAALIPLDQHVSDLSLKRMDCIKIDVEGYEFEVLSGAQETLNRFKPVIFGEFNTEFMRQRGIDLDDSWIELKTMGYDLQQKVSGVWTSVENRPEQRCWNLRMEHVTRV